jgi:hypothetical protein
MDNKKVVRGIQKEAQRSANEMKKQLEEMNKKYIELQTEYNFAR